jgi:membrane-associated phospholipid phosphatase
MTRNLGLVMAALGAMTGTIARVGRADVGGRVSDSAPAPRDVSAPPTTFPVSSTPIGAGLRRRHEGKRLAWDPAFNRVDAPEFILTSVAVGVALGGAIAPPLNTGWKGPVGFDESVRHALRLGSYQARLDARDVSDVGLALMTSYPILVDSLIVAYWYRGNEDVAVQMALIDAEAMAVTAAIQGAATFFGGRERPYGSDCGGEVPAQSIDCTSPSRYRSFFSGHSALSFTSAALVCAHHMSLDLFESAADPVACVSAFVAAGAVATLRVVGDVHYASDVIAGALVGTAVGLGFPLLHHYSRSAVEGPASSGLDVRFVPTPFGGQLVGAF